MMNKQHARGCRRRLRTLLVTAMALGLSLAPAAGDDTKYEYQIPMRDGVHLFTAVYLPKDDSREYGILMLRTPYDSGPYGVDNYPARLGPSEKFAREGFIFVVQDVRGHLHRNDTAPGAQGSPRHRRRVERHV
ncbi:MAG: hypothetical protein O2782_09620 [bacterium]|nr:hypothetical protein [bacterium]